MSCGGKKQQIWSNCKRFEKYGFRKLAESSWAAVQTDKSKRFVLVWKQDLIHLHEQVLQGPEYADDQPTRSITSKLFMWYYSLVDKIAAIEEKTKMAKASKLSDN